VPGWSGAQAPFSIGRMLTRFSPTSIGRWSTRRPKLAIADWLGFAPREYAFLHGDSETAGDPAFEAARTALVGRPRPGHNPIDELTDREREVLELMAEGRSNRAIAAHRRVRAVVTYLNSQ
jgi:Bacterial regulatory proteins, luxR family